MRKKAYSLVLVTVIILILLTLSSVSLFQSISEKNLTQRYKDSLQAFWIAEAGVNKALQELRNDFNWTGEEGNLEDGSYEIIVNVIDSKTREVLSSGYIPSKTNYRTKRTLKAIMSKFIPSGFYDYTVYCAGDVEINGDSFSIVNNQPSPDDKALIYSGEYQVGHPENITGQIEQDESISPLARLDFQQLYNIASSQGNVYDETRLQEVKNGNDSFPSSFWYSEGVPNVVYVTTDLELNGDIGTIGGFFVVAGDIITDPDDTDDIVINGNGQIDGVIYTRGQFRINGGGGGLNVDGGVWAQEVRINGNAHLAYNADYMSAIENLGIEASVQITAWRDLNNPYQF
ncbi:MAG TPA: hypothetical protein ENI31_06000 [Candidatus Omnitrophica bacterium]|nr:hypothetical protein [Candidatus Omnitrophota bacterium]